jgi:hypothetical protein
VSPRIDGYYWNGTGDCTTVGYTNCSAFLTTRSSPDLAIVFAQTEAAQPVTCLGLAPPAVTSVTDSAGLTWHLRNSVTSGQVITGTWCYQFHIAEWYARPNSTLTNDKVEIHVAGGLGVSQYMMLLAFGVANINQLHPFDSNPGATCTASGVSTVMSCDVSTSNPNDLIVGGPDFYFGSFSFGTGYQAIAPSFGPDCSTQVDVSCSEYQAVGSVQTNLAVSYTQATSAIWCLLADSIQGNDGS